MQTISERQYKALQFNKEYHFMELMDGDRFYFASDKSKVVHQVQWDIVFVNGRSIKTDKELHFRKATAKQKSSKVIFLRHKGQPIK